MGFKIVKMFFVVMRAIPIIVLIGTMMWIFFNFKASVSYGTVDRYVFDVGKNLLSSELTSERNVFDAIKLDLYTEKKDDIIPILNQVNATDFLTYGADIYRLCKSKDDCTDYCTDICQEPITSDKCALPSIISSDDPYIRYGLDDSKFCACDCDNGKKGFWRLGISKTSRSFIVLDKSDVDFIDFTPLIEVNGNLYTGLLRIDVVKEYYEDFSGG